MTAASGPAPASSAGDGPLASGSVEYGPAERGSRVAIAGFVFAGLFAVAWMLMQQSPPLDSSTEELVAYFSDARRRRASLMAGLYVVPFAAIAFIWFMAALRDRYLRSTARENVVLSTVHLISGTLFVVALFAVGAVELSLVWAAQYAEQGTVDVESTRLMMALGATMAQIVAVRSAAVFIATSSARAVRSGLFPRWFGVVSLAIAAILLLVSTELPVTALLMPVWVVASSLFVLAERQTHSVDTA